MDSIYAKEPIRWEDGIPVFSEKNAYVENYDAIAADHLKEFRKTGKNPFMPPDLVEELESDTAALVAEYHPAHGRILDVGVGLGSLLRRCGASAGEARYGIDISLEYLKVAKSRGIEVCCGLVEDIPYKQEFFDTVVTTDVIEHVVDLNYCCGRILSVLKPGGYLVIRVPVGENLAPYLDPALPYQLVHLRTFDESGLRLIFEKLFQCKFIKSVYSGHLMELGRLKQDFAAALQGQNEVAAIGEELRVAGNQEMYRRYARLFFRPIDMNVVFQKTGRTEFGLGYELAGAARSGERHPDQARWGRAVREAEKELGAREAELKEVREALAQAEKNLNNPLILAKRLMELIMRKG